MFFKYYSESYI